MTAKGGVVGWHLVSCYQTCFGSSFQVCWGMTKFEREIRNYLLGFLEEMVLNEEGKGGNF